jgi:phosphatidate cytidylyltransferase
LAAIILLPTQWLVVALLIVVAMAAREWGRFIWPDAIWAHHLYAIATILTGAAVVTWLDVIQVSPVILAVGAVWWCLCLLWLFVGNPSVTPGGAWTKALIGQLVMLPALHALAWLHAVSPWWLLSVFLMIWAADVGAYFAGRRWGKRKLAPKVSPGKTWAGVFGGLALVALLTVLVSMLVFADWLTSLLLLALSVPVVLLSVVGDLVESLMKRQAGIKDSGRLLPGHGGVMDRFDSLFAAAPVFALGLWYLLGQTVNG